MTTLEKCFIAAVAIFIASVLAVAAFIHHLLYPPNMVELHLERVPPDVEAIYVVARNGQEVAPLQWYFGGVFPDYAPAKEVGEAWFWTVTGDRRRGDVQWRSADSYGILAKRKSGEWALWWLDPRDVEGPSLSRYLHGGGEKVTIRANGIAAATEAPKSLMDQIKQDE